jgi:hypothetical protein
MFPDPKITVSQVRSTFWWLSRPFFAFSTVSLFFILTACPLYLFCIAQCLGVSYVFSLTMVFLLQDALVQQSRITRLTFIAAALSAFVLGTVMSLFVWQDDVEVFSSKMLRFKITKYTIWRGCWLGQFMLASKSFYTSWVDYDKGELLCLVDGFVLRQSVMELKDPLRGRVNGDF